ncbi:secreted frizzled-related protein 5-like [Dendronephthya gigantea]|uniref:secreted frizzled-related protein 5-like n=1 Tax=Dendronephthya gigantea TaxID=151771 RepID=UPI00106962A2|nr:secreted frizzled-related protein 5-like [Dendronephthya gigantea]
MNIYMLSFFAISVSYASVQKQNECHLAIPRMCKGLNGAYTKMRLPNMLNHTRRFDVLKDIDVWKPLLNSSCNSGDQLTLFLCLTYAPVCIPKHRVPPCKSLCESVRNSCEPLMLQHNRSWPATFDCNERRKFYNDSSSSMCMNTRIFGSGKKIPCPCRMSHKTLCNLISTSPFVFTASVKRVRARGKKDQIDVTIFSRILRQMKGVKKTLKSGALQRLHLSHKKKCSCKKLLIKAKSSRRYLVVGKKVGRKMIVDAIKLVKGPRVANSIFKKCKT